MITFNDIQQKYKSLTFNQKNMLAALKPLHGYNIAVCIRNATRLPPSVDREAVINYLTYVSSYEFPPVYWITDFEDDQVLSLDNFERCPLLEYLGLSEKVEQLKREFFNYVFNPVEIETPDLSYYVDDFLEADAIDFIDEHNASLK